MILNSLHLRHFGPFREYKVTFLKEEGVCILLTGKNNEGKSNILMGLKLLNAALRVANKKKQAILLNGAYFYRLLQQDTEDLPIRRMIHNYATVVAEVQGYFEGGLKVSVYLDPNEDLIYADYEGRLPAWPEHLFGFIPPLGPLDEQEQFIGDKSYLKACINTSLAPRHLRNHLVQILSKEEYAMIQGIIHRSWENIELLDWEVRYQDNRIDCYYKENGIRREISWAGQGLQVWFQIVTHLVRLRHTSLLILDEPEINLHPEKQNDLLRIIKEHYRGSVLIATHSVELMNNVSVSHILHVQKGSRQPKLKETSDRTNLEMIRSQVGSYFNLIASQFEECEALLFTEDTSDFKILKQLAAGFNIHRNVINVPIHGFSEYRKAIFYKEAYKLLIGKDVDYLVVLDRDYYPEQYLNSVTEELKAHGIKTVFTLGKEMENLFLHPSVLKQLIPSADQKAFTCFWENVFKAIRFEALGSYQTLHQRFVEPRVDAKTITVNYLPIFETRWTDPKTKNDMISGKLALKSLRDFFSNHYKQNLADRALVEKVIEANRQEVRRWVTDAYGL